MILQLSGSTIDPDSKLMASLNVFFPCFPRQEAWLLSGWPGGRQGRQAVGQGGQSSSSVWSRSGLCACSPSLLVCSLSVADPVKHHGVLHHGHLFQSYFILYNGTPPPPSSSNCASLHCSRQVLLRGPRTHTLATPTQHPASENGPSDLSRAHPAFSPAFIPLSYGRRSNQAKFFFSKYVLIS